MRLEVKSPSYDLNTFPLQILEQVEGGDLVVNKGNESKPKDDREQVERELNAVESFDDAVKLATVRRTRLSSRSNAHLM